MLWRIPDLGSNAEESRILLERALVEQHERYQRQCDKVEVLQAGQQYQKLQQHLENLQHRESQKLHHDKVSANGSSSTSAAGSLALESHGSSPQMRYGISYGESTNHGRMVYRSMGAEHGGHVLARSSMSDSGYSYVLPCACAPSVPDSFLSFPTMRDNMARNMEVGGNEREKALLVGALMEQG